MGDEIYSAKSKISSTSQHCDKITKSGTSMSTPLGAAAVAILEEYFLNGYYPSGTKTDADAFVPSSALIKAMLIHSGEYSYGYVEENYYTEHKYTTWPNNKQGFGIVSLDRVLYFDDDKHFRLNIIQKNIYITNQTQPFNYYYNTKQMFKATLYWNDPPVSTKSNSLLLNDLDLKIIINGTEVLYGNCRNTPDSLNNVEVIIIPPNYIQYNDRVPIEVIVSYSNLSVIQDYVLIITGDFYDSFYSLDNDYNPLPTPCVIPDPKTGYVSFNEKLEIGYILIIVVGCILVVVLLITCIYMFSYNIRKRRQKLTIQRAGNTGRLVTTPDKVDNNDSSCFVATIKRIPDNNARFYNNKNEIK